VFIYYLRDGNMRWNARFGRQVSGKVISVTAWNGVWNHQVNPRDSEDWSVE